MTRLSAHSGLRRLTAAAISAMMLLASAPLLARPDDSADFGHAQRTVLGWTGTDEEVVVRLKSRGERMVNGDSRDFYFEATETYRADTGALIFRYKHGQAVGAPNPVYQKARPQKEGDEYFKNVGLLKARPGWESPNGRYALTTFSSHTYQKIPVPRRGTQFACVTTTHVVLLDGKDRKAYMVDQWRGTGERAALKKDADCPRAAEQPYWHPGSTNWALVRTIRSPASLVTPPVLVTGQVSQLSKLPAIPIAIARQPLQQYVASLPKGAVKEAMVALFAGQLDNAQKGLTTFLKKHRRDVPARLMLAYVEALNGRKRRARRSVWRAYRESGKDFWTLAQVAAVDARLGESRTEKRDLQRALKKTSNYYDILLMGELFFHVDIHVANQLLNDAISSPSAKNANTAWGYLLLARGLAISGDYTDALTLTDKISNPTTAVAAEKLRIAMEQGTLKHPVEAMASFLDQHPGNCEGYLLYGRALSRADRAGDALDQFRAASICNPKLTGALYDLGDMERLRGNVDKATTDFRAYLALATPRLGDPVRSARRAHLNALLKRLEHQGAVLASVQCRPMGQGASLCQGMIQNTTGQALTNVEVMAYKGRESRVLGKYMINTIPPDSSRPFGVRVVSKDLAHVMLEAGRDKRERKINRVPIPQ